MFHCRPYMLLAAVLLAPLVGCGPEEPDSGAANAAAVSTPPPAATAKPRELAETLFDGKSLAGWTVAEDGDFSGHGKVVVRDGTIRLDEGDPATGIVRTSEPPRMNYEVSLKAMRTSGGDFFCGLTFPVGPQYCSFIVGGWGGNVVGLSNINGSAANENETTTNRTFEDNRWYRLRLRVTPKNISAWIDDEQVIDLETKDLEFDIWIQQQPMRPLGMATWNTGAALKDIQLKRIDEAPGPGQTTAPGRPPK